MHARFLGQSLAAAAVAGSLACSDSTTANVGLYFSTRPAPGAALPVSAVAAGDSTVLALGSDTIIIRSVEMVLREVELQRIDVPDCPDSLSSNDPCEEFETGPVLVSLPLGNATEVAVSIAAPPGTYNEFESKVHKPSSSDDAAFLALHPDFDGVSIRVTGTYSAAGSRSDFVFTSELDKEQEHALNPPLTVGQGANANLTMRVDISTWFLNTGGTALVNPATANKGGQNEGVVKNNIEQSIEAFHDDDHDGLDDDSEDDDGGSSHDSP